MNAKEFLKWTSPNNDVGVRADLGRLEKHIVKIMEAYAEHSNQWVSVEDIDKKVEEYGFRVPYDGTDDFYDKEAINHFKAGVKWVLEQIKPPKK